jgi:hypothetical protein
MFGLILTIALVDYGSSAPVVAWVSNQIPIRRVIGGTAAMAISLPFLSLSGGVVQAAIVLCVVSVCYALMLNLPRQSLAMRSTGAACPVMRRFTPSTTSPTR